MPSKKPILGPLQPIWDAWEEQRDFIDGIPDIYFESIIWIQFNEIDDHKEAGHPPERTTNEIVDIMSICLNWLRARGYDDQGVADAIAARTPRFDDTASIIRKYEEDYWL